MFSSKRKVGQSLYITTPEGRLIRIIVTDSYKGHAVLSVDADKSVKILRNELVGKEPKGKS